MRLIIASANPHKAVEMEQVLNQALAGDSITVVAPPASYLAVVEDGETLEANARLKAEACSVIVKAAAGSVLGEAVVADDTGLEVDALGGAPGVRSARYAGEDATDEQNRQKLLAALQGVEPQQRTARFRTVVVLRLVGEPGTGLASTGLSGTGLASTGLSGTGEASTGLASTELAGTGLAATELVAHGCVEGAIAESERGTDGFGYDSLFVPFVSTQGSEQPLAETLAEAGSPTEMKPLAETGSLAEMRTFAQMTAAEKHAISHRGRALRALANQLSELTT